MAIFVNSGKRRIYIYKMATFAKARASLRPLFMAEARAILHWLVRRIALHPDPDHSRDPHEQATVHPEPGQQGTHPDFPGDCGIRCMAALLTIGRSAWVCSTTTVVLAVVISHADGLRAADPAGQDLVREAIWRGVEGSFKYCVWRAVNEVNKRRYIFLFITPVLKVNIAGC